MKIYDIDVLYRRCPICFLSAYEIVAEYIKMKQTTNSFFYWELQTVKRKVEQHLKYETDRGSIKYSE